MLVQPQQAATVCELDPVQHTIGSAKRAQTLDPNQPPENSYDPLNLTLDLEYAHVSGHSPEPNRKHGLGRSMACHTEFGEHERRCTTCELCLNSLGVRPEKD